MHKFKLYFGLAAAMTLSGVAGAYADDGASVTPPSTITEDSSTGNTETIAGQNGTGSGNGGTVNGPVTINVDGTAGQNYQTTIVGGNGGPDNGNGGNTPDTTVTVDGDSHTVFVENQGGNAGGTGTGGDGGDIHATVGGNNDSVTLISNGGNGATPGAGGNIDATFDGKTDFVFVSTDGGKAGIHDPVTGPSGDINLTIKGEVGNVNTVSTGSNPGQVTVTLENGAVVNGTLHNASGDGKLVFAFQFENQAQKDAASAALASAQGSVVINGNTYAWDGFDQLQDMLSVAEQNNPGGEPPVVIIDGNTHSNDNTVVASNGPVCSGPVVKAVAKHGDVILSTRNPGEMRFVLGFINASGYTSNGDAKGWTVDLGVKKGHEIALVKNPAGKLVSTCTL